MKYGAAKQDFLISAFAWVLFVLALLLLCVLPLQFQTILALNLAHGLLARVQVSLHLCLPLQCVPRQLREGVFDIYIVSR